MKFKVSGSGPLIATSKSELEDLLFQQEIPHDRDLIVVKQGRCVADAGDFHDFRPRAAYRLLLRGVAPEQVRLLAAQDKGRAADRVVEAPQLPGLRRLLGIERHGNSRVVV